MSVSFFMQNSNIKTCKRANIRLSACFNKYNIGGIKHHKTWCHLALKAFLSSLKNQFIYSIILTLIHNKSLFFLKHFKMLFKKEHYGVFVF